MPLAFDSIYSLRKQISWVSWHIVFEWEDVIAAQLKIPIVDAPPFFFASEKMSTRPTHPFEQEAELTSPRLAFLMKPVMLEQHRGNKKLVPILIDCWEEDLEQIHRYFQDGARFLVTSFQVYDLLRARWPKLRVGCLPLSVPDNRVEREHPLKTIDLFQFGRRNPVLHSYALTYSRKHPELNYVYGDWKDGATTYYSSKTGLLGRFDRRSELFALLRRARISLVSGPRIDVAPDKFLSPVTPRFYESAASFCHLLGRYHANADFLKNDIPSLCPNVGSYEEFEGLATEMLSSEVDKSLYRIFLDKHCTSYLCKTILQSETLPWAD